MGKNKSNFVSDIYDNVKYLFEPPTEYDKKTLKKKWKEDSPSIMLELAFEFEKLEIWDKENIQKTFENYVESSGNGFGVVMPALRLVITGKGFGSDIFETLEIIGKEETINRLKDSVNIKK